MNPISLIRARLGVTQQTLAAALNVSQGNISHYERGQSVPPDVAKKLISYGHSLGQKITFDDVYGALGDEVKPSDQRRDSSELQKAS